MSLRSSQKRKRRNARYRRKIERILASFYPGPATLQIITEEMRTLQDQYECLETLQEMAFYEAEQELPYATFH